MAALVGGTVVVWYAEAMKEAVKGDPSNGSLCPCLALFILQSSLPAASIDEVTMSDTELL
jgi:hypothetical protein